MSRMQAQFALACGLMVASGCAALAYQIVWTQQSTLWLGHEAPAVLAVVAAFFGGLALGSLILSSRIQRSSQPGRWYAGCEIIIGLWTLALSLLLEPVSSALLALIGPQPTALWHGFIAFFGTFALLLPATMAMGATLPAMERVLHLLAPRSSTISVLYAANTFGAVLGVLVSAFWLVPRFGLLCTTLLCAVLNFACAAAVLRVRHDARQEAQPSKAIQAPGVMFLLGATGLLGIGYEVLVVRALSHVAENTVYTFAILLAVYLVGTTIGASLYARWLAERAHSSRIGDRLLQILAAVCLSGILLLWMADETKRGLLHVFGSSMKAAIAAEALISACAFLLPTIAMGAMFSHLGTRARLAGIRFGDALGINTIGAALAPLLFGVALVPWLGLKSALFLIPAGYLALTTRMAWRTPTQWSAIGLAVVAFLLLPSLLSFQLPVGARLVAHTEGVMGSVSIVEDENGTASLHINNRQQEGSNATVFADARQGLLPILLHPAPRRALFLGVGTGLTVSSAASDLSLRVDAVELIPEVLDTTHYFAKLTGTLPDNSRLHLMSADARRFVRTSRNRYDVIVSDNFHPARSGSGSLYTREHFAAVRGRLAAGGLFCQWLPLHQLDLSTARTIVRTFLSVYPNGFAMLATNSLETPVLGLVAREADQPFELSKIHSRLNDSSISLDLAQFGIEDELALLGTFIAGPSELEHFAANAPVNTDDQPVVTYVAPRITYEPDSLPRDRLLQLLQELDVSAGDLLADADVDWEVRLNAYWTARDHFIEAGRNVEPTSDVRNMVAQVREPLLSVLRLSPDFRPAYDPLLNMAVALGSIDADAARRLLGDLQAAQPSRPEAAQAMRELVSHSALR
jgi:spermidine synthase